MTAISDLRRMVPLNSGKKLGVRSRTELTRMLLAHDTSAEVISLTALDHRSFG